MVDKMMKVLMVAMVLGVGQAKMCWQECGDQGVIQAADIVGCHRRSTYPNIQNFRCEGTVGPPCTVERGDTVMLDVAWNNPGVANMTQSTVWVTGSWGVELPWIGMETEGCQFLDEGRGCRPDSKAQVSKFEFPIFIQEIYPTGKYDLKWKFWERTETGEEIEKACFLFTIKIV
eukprot:GFUD01032195.1.p1 GENE.GFUD01032195.1~~GFUD01032195.1.p1  ORF type:complete len:174 (-),score=57.44 GFUD01032195.1:111-632(-)